MATLSFMLLIVAVASANELTPFIAWSTDKSLDQFKLDSKNVNELALKLGSTSASTVVLFAFDKLSFDDIAKYGGIYNSNDDTTQLESSIESAQFQYWTGLNPVSNDWVSKLTSKKPIYVNAQDISKTSFSNQLYIIPLSSTDGFQKNDAIVGRVMKMLQSNKDGSHLCIYTQLPPPQKSNSRSSRSISKRSAQIAAATTNTYCPIGGRLTANDNNTDSGTCMLFCLSDSIQFLPKAINKNSTCNLTLPYKITYNCSGSNDTEGVVLDEYGTSYPSVTVYYSARPNNTINMSTCVPDVWSDFNNQSDGFVKELDIILTFFFPANFSYNDSTVPSNDWAVMISSITVQRLAEIDGDDEPPQQPPDDENENENEKVSKRYLLTRFNYTRLHQRFLVPSTNSYACSGSMMNTYTATLYNADNGTFSILGFDSNDTDAHGLNLTSIQVQPYNVENATEFSVADNCIGYFTEAGWMGIISMAILIIIIYLAIVCAFSIKTLDQFEDPRGQTISVEKLH